jgi:hypothetical protein
MTSQTRRRSGLVLLALLAVQSVAAPLGACAQDHEQHEAAAHEMTTMDQAHAGGPTVGMEQVGSSEAEHAPYQAPVDCLALAACGAPAVGSSVSTAHVILADLSTRSLPAVSGEPAAIVLGLTTPPPKI